MIHNEVEKKQLHVRENVYTELFCRGLLDTSVFEQLRYAVRRMILETYIDFVFPRQPVSCTTPVQYERNEEIRLRHRQGETLMSLAELFNLSESRVWQIIHYRRK